MTLPQLKGTDVEMQFIDKVLQSNKPVLVQFYRNNSGLSFLADLLMQEFMQDLDGKVFFYKINVEQHPFFKDAYSLQELPTVLLFINGAICGYLSGAFSKQKFVSTIIDKI